MTSRSTKPPREAAAFEWLESGPIELSQPEVELYALELERLLWHGHHEIVIPQLQAMVKQAPALEKAAACWALARWEACNGELDRAFEAIMGFHANREAAKAVLHAGPFLLAIELSLLRGETSGAQSILARGLREFGEVPDFILARFMLASAQSDSDSKLSEILSELYEREGLRPVMLGKDAAPAFDRLYSCEAQAPIAAGTELPLVSVIVPVFNASAVLRTALRGLLRQSWSALEILVMDDGSSDDSVAISQTVAARDARVRVIALGRNEGAYSARNAGLAEAKGDFITVHDADDWSHPQKIEMQVRALLDNLALKASVSHWARAGDGMEFTRWRMEESWIHRNVSSLMIRRELRDQLGFWDRARVNADTEYYYRIIKAYGADAIGEVCRGIPLTFGRTMRDSLTNQSATHLRTQYHGVRHDYLEAAHDWHRQSTQPSDLYLPRFPTQRPFHIPSAIAAHDVDDTIKSDASICDFDLLVASGLLDEEWYQLANPEILHSGIGAARHYLAFGAGQNRDPGPLFSTGGYRLAQGLSAKENPLLLYLREGRQDGAQPLPSFVGKLAATAPQNKRVLVFAHTSGATLFGAERSFLAMVERLVRDGFAPVVVLPSLQNSAYLEQLLEISLAVEVLPQLWRNGLRPPQEQTVDAIRALIKKHQPYEVQVNTLTLEAPLVAARAEEVPSVVYVREMPSEDAALCRMLGMGPNSLRHALLDQVDRFLMPSQVVADWLGAPEICTVRPNAVDEALFDLPFEPGRLLKIGLISSNITKKGIGDLVAAAHMIAAMGPPIRFLLIGPRTQDLQFLEPLPPNVELCDYVASPAEAIAQVDVVVSLSHFAESFGRTVVEAMAAGRPVICYDRGAPPSLVLNGETGIVVPAGSTMSVVDAVLALDVARLQLRKMSKSARRRAQDIQDQALR